MVTVSNKDSNPSPLDIHIHYDYHSCFDEYVSLCVCCEGSRKKHFIGILLHTYERRYMPSRNPGNLA